MSTKIGNVLYLIGGTCTGKTTLARKLEERGFRWIRSVTSRPKRKGECDEYAEWVGEAEFNLRKAAGEFDYVREYYTHGASWFYGFRRADLTFRSDARYVMIGDPVSARRALSEFSNVLMLKALGETVRIRLQDRGNCSEFIRRRLQKDAEDFGDFMWFVRQKTRECRWVDDFPAMRLVGSPFSLMVCYNDFEVDLPRLLDYIERKVPRP